MSAPRIDGKRLVSRLRVLGEIGRDKSGALTRLAASDEDKAARDQYVTWLKDAGLEVRIDQIGNTFGVWQSDSAVGSLMMGSHIDSVINAGIYDGCYGVIAGLSVIEALRAAGVQPDRALVVASFTNEEGVRYTPDMMGSLVYAGGLDVDTALASVGTDGSVLGEELARIGYAGSMMPGAMVPSAFLELHIEQGPVLEAEGKTIGAVANLQGISWQKITIHGTANHAGTTPTHLRKDAGLAAAKVTTYLRELVDGSNSVATVGTIRYAPNAINVVPSVAEFTVDVRDPDEAVLKSREAALQAFLQSLEQSDGVTISTKRLVRFEPVTFDPALVKLIEASSAERGISCHRMTSGAGHDAQMLAQLCPAAMIFVPSKDGISHNPREHTDEEALVTGAQVLLDTVLKIVGAP